MSTTINLGRVQGYSAYEVAVQQGYVGTRDEWLASLKGDKGDPGETGATGPQGPQGLQGPQGEQGNTGSSVDYPYELVNNVTTDDATKGLSAAQGVVLDGKITELGQQAIYDVSARNGGATFASLSALLSNENLSTLIPAAVRCGGMSIRFVLTSDNKYVQYRLMADEWTTDTNDWSIVEEGIYVRHHTYIYVLSTKDNKFIAGVKSNGDIEWASGVPTPVKQYITTAIVGKVDVEEGKGLIDDSYSGSISSVKNTHYLEVDTDRNGNVLGGRKSDGARFEDAGLYIGKTKVDSFKLPNYIDVVTDKDGKIVEYRKENGVHGFPAGIEAPELVSLNNKIDNVRDEIYPFGELPSYYTEQWKEAMIAGINEQVAVESGCSFVFFTDVHFGPYQPGNSKYLIKMILDKTPVPFVVCGGDIPYSYGSEEDLDNEIQQFKNYQEYIGKERFYTIRGNHDLGVTKSPTETDVRYVKSFGEVNSIFSLNNGWKLRGLSEHMCYVLENRTEKIRILLLNSQDKVDPTFSWGTYNYISAAQIKWLLDDVLLDDGYKYIAISHVPADTAISYGDVSQSALHNLLIAVKNHSEFSQTVDGIALSKDFTDFDIDVICHLTGHCHTDESHVDNNLLSITTTCDVAIGTGRVRGTVSEQAFDVFTVDLKNSKLYAYRVGYGENREWNI